MIAPLVSATSFDMGPEQIRNCRITYTTNDVAPETWHAHIEFPDGRVATTSQLHFMHKEGAWREDILRKIDARIGPTDERQMVGITGTERPWWPPPNGTEWVRVHKQSGLRWQPIDVEVADIVKQLHDECTITSVASCGGHGKEPGHVLLADGRVLLVLPDLKVADELVAYCRRENICGWRDAPYDSISETAQRLREG